MGMRERNARMHTDNVISLTQYRKFKSSNQAGETLFSIVSDIARKNADLQAKDKKLRLISPEIHFAKSSEIKISSPKKEDVQKDAVILVFPLKKESL